MTIQPHTKAVCEAHYNQGSGCGKCPIQQECYSSPVKLSDDGLRAWIDRCDKAAAAIGEGM